MKRKNRALIPPNRVHRDRSKYYRVSVREFAERMKVEECCELPHYACEGCNPNENLGCKLRGK